jgi:hypothetical protein
LDSSGHEFSARCLRTPLTKGEPSCAEAFEAPDRLSDIRDEQIQCIRFFTVFGSETLCKVRVMP